jgi:hypothetical protein
MFGPTSVSKKTGCETRGHSDPSDDCIEMTILARVLVDERGTLSVPMARYILSRGFNDVDKARMHDLAVRNQDDALSDAERSELLAYARAGDLLSILKAKARQVVRMHTKKGS